VARSLGELAAQFGCELIGDPSILVTRVATLPNAGDGHLCFFANKHYRNELLATKATAVILRADDQEDCPVSALLADDPYLTYARIATELHPAPATNAGAHSSATVSESASIGEGSEISANATICDGVVLGENVYIGPGVVVGPRSTVGDDTRVLANASLLQEVEVGARCIIHAGAVIGSDGFGNARRTEGGVMVPQIGGVRIGNDVEIGTNATIDRGAIDDTVIEDGVRLDNLVHLAHNVRLGAHTAIAALTGVSGSTVIGKRCMFGGQVGIVGHLTICDDVVVGGATVIYKDIRQPGYYSGSFPGEPDRDWKRRVARFRRLGDLVDRVAALEKAQKDREG
jgi:UDP-3-O-[3-hydroxymyristoyl] glucosamine N-acyltransferase